MAEGDITLIYTCPDDNTEITAVTSCVRAGTANRLEYEASAAAEYGLKGASLARAGLNRGEVFNFSHLFSKEDACAVKEMAYLTFEAEQQKEDAEGNPLEFCVTLVDERCKVPDSNPPIYSYVADSLEVSPSGKTTKAHRIYKAMFRTLPICEGCIGDDQELSFVMQVCRPFFASETCPAPELAVSNPQTIPEDADTSGGPILAFEFS